jgi:hypothetical protein
MHWTLVEFREPLLVTCDHPVVVWPLAWSDATRPRKTDFRKGVLPTLEVRFPLSPRLLLLMTWRAPTDGRPLAGRFQHALNANAWMRCQASPQWFVSPATKPRFASGRTRPLSLELFPDYGLAQAEASLRRARASALIQPRLGEGMEQESVLQALQLGVVARHAPVAHRVIARRISTERPPLALLKFGRLKRTGNISITLPSELEQVHQHP